MKNKTIGYRSERINLRLTPEQKEKLKSEASAEGVSMTEYLLKSLGLS